MVEPRGTAYGGSEDELITTTEGTSCLSDTCLLCSPLLRSTAVASRFRSWGEKNQPRTVCKGFLVQYLEFCESSFSSDREKGLVFFFLFVFGTKKIVRFFLFRCSKTFYFDVSLRLFYSRLEKILFYFFFLAIRVHDEWENREVLERFSFVDHAP